MKRNMLAKKLMAGLLTGAMVLSMGGMTAFAEVETADITSGNTGVVEVEGDKVTLTKNINIENENALMPNVKFEFTIAPTDDYIDQSADLSNSGLVIYEGVSGGISESAAFEFKPGDEKTKNVDLTLDASKFTAPGIYRYKVTENDFNYTGMGMNPYDGVDKDETTYYLDVYVENGEGETFSPAINYVVVSKYNTESEKLEKADLEFNNAYTANDLKVTKVVSGNQGDKEKEFTFNVIINGAVGEKYNTDYYLEGSESPEVFEANTNYQITLSHDESINIYGLSENDTYTVVEVDANKDGYTTTYYNTNDENDELGQRDDIINIKEGLKNREVEVRNERNVTTPTGIAMTFAPYAVMVVFAGVFAVMFLRKKREDF